MSALTAAVRLDLLTVRPYAAQVLLLLGLGTVVAVTMRNPYAATPLLMVYGVLVTTYAFAVSDKNNLETLYATLPLRRGTLVAARYVMSILALAAVLLLSLLTGWLTALTTGEPYSPASAVVLATLCLAVVLVVLSVQFPLYFALGYTRARLLAVAPLVVLLILVMVVVNVRPGAAAGLVALLESPSARPVALALAVAAVLTAASVLVSRALYRAKDL